MAKKEQLVILNQGVDAWNKWREGNPDIVIDLSEADLSGTNLRKVNLSDANLNKTNLSGTKLMYADLTNALLIEASLVEANLHKSDLTGANLGAANLSRAKLTEADLFLVNLARANLLEARLYAAILDRADLWQAQLCRADLRWATLYKTVLREADLRNADLSNASLIATRIDNANISNSRVYGVSIWDLQGQFKEQEQLIITPDGQSAIRVDNIEIAQFIYLIINNQKIRQVINTLTSKSVLILGRFAIPARKAILDALRNELREYDLLPIVFDFDRPTDKDFTETINTLAGLCYFVIADVTNPKSAPLELQSTVPDYQIPFVPIIQEGEYPFAMMVDLQKKYNWVLNTVSYDSQETLMKVLKPLVIDPAMKKRQELRLTKAQEPEIISAKDFLAKGGS
jgi:uncharacterized protein YjbI with pentapeptide repeats